MSPTRFGPQPFRPQEGGDARGPGIAALMSLNVERLAAAATALLVRVAEHEPRLQLLLDVVHFGAEDEHNGLRVDQDGHSLILDDLVVFTLIVGVFERVGQARAAARPHPDAHPNRGFAATGEQRLDALRRRIRYDQSLLLRHMRSTPDILHIAVMRRSVNLLRRLRRPAEAATRPRRSLRPRNRPPLRS